MNAASITLAILATVIIRKFFIYIVLFFRKIINFCFGFFCLFFVFFWLLLIMFLFFLFCVEKCKMKIVAMVVRGVLMIPVLNVVQ